MAQFVQESHHVPTEGILIGRGGGFTQHFVAFAFNMDARLLLLSYVANLDGSIPERIDTVLLPWNAADPLPGWMGGLEAAGFWDTPSDFGRSETWDYLLMARAGRTHLVQWSNAAAPSIPVAIYWHAVQIRHWIAQHMLGGYGA